MLFTWRGKCATITRKGKTMKKYFLMQKLLGVLLILANVAYIIFEKDGTASILLVPMGLYAIFTKDKIMNF